VSEFREVWQLDRRHIIVLLFLHRAGRAIKTAIMEALGVRNAAYVERVLLDLIELGLVREEKLGRRVRVFELTERGRRVAEALDALARELRGEGEGGG